MLSCRLLDPGLVEYRIQRPLGKRLAAVVRHDRAPTCRWIEPAAMTAYAVAPNKAVGAKMRLDLPCVQRLHANATAWRLRSIRRRSFRR